jgi:hypothetical protein
VVHIDDLAGLRGSALLEVQLSVCFGFGVRGRGSGGQEGEEGNCETEELHFVSVAVLTETCSIAREDC